MEDRSKADDKFDRYSKVVAWVVIALYGVRTLARYAFSYQIPEWAELIVLAAIVTMGVLTALSGRARKNGRS